MKKNNDLSRTDINTKPQDLGGNKWSDLKQLPTKTSKETNSQIEKDKGKGQLETKMEKNKRDLKHPIPEKNEPSFGMNPYEYKAKMAEHLTKANNYERQANDLERRINQKLEPQSKKSEIIRLRSMASIEKQKYNDTQNKFRQELRQEQQTAVIHGENIDSKKPEIKKEQNQSKNGPSFKSCASFCQRTKTNSSNGGYTSRGL